MSLIDGLRRRFVSQQNILSLYVPAFTLALGNGVAAPALPVYAKSFDVDFGIAALVIIVYEIGGLASTVPTGFMMDRFGRRRIRLAGPLLVALSSILVATAHSFPELLVYRFIGGWARQMWMLSRLTVISDTGARESRGRQITSMIGFEGMGRLMGPAVGGSSPPRRMCACPSFCTRCSRCSPLRRASNSSASRARRPPRARGMPALTENLAGSARAALLTIPVLMFFVAQFLASFARGTLIGGSVQLYAVYQYGVGRRCSERSRPGRRSSRFPSCSAPGTPWTASAGRSRPCRRFALRRARPGRRYGFRPFTVQRLCRFDLHHAGLAEPHRGQYAGHRLGDRARAQCAADSSASGASSARSARPRARQCLPSSHRTIRTPQDSSRSASPRLALPRCSGPRSGTRSARQVRASVEAPKSGRERPNPSPDRSPFGPLDR